MIQVGPVCGMSPQQVGWNAEEITICQAQNQLSITIRYILLQVAPQRGTCVVVFARALKRVFEGETNVVVR